MALLGRLPPRAPPQQISLHTERSEVAIPLPRLRDWGEVGLVDIRCRRGETIYSLGDYPTVEQTADGPDTGPAVTH